jgi:hypothetical protein
VILHLFHPQVDSFSLITAAEAKKEAGSKMKAESNVVDLNEEKKKKMKSVHTSNRELIV